MRKRIVIVIAAASAALGVSVLAAGGAAAGPLDGVPAACVVVDADPLHLQLGYAPDGPGDCTVPTPA